MTSNADSITLVENALQENAARKTTLSSYIQQLEKELASVDALIVGAFFCIDGASDGHMSSKVQALA